LIKDVTILGGTSAGFLTALALKAKIPSLRVRLLQLPEAEMPETQSSTLALTRFLHAYLQIDLTKFIRSTKANWTLGHMFHWGPRGHYILPYTTQLDQRLGSLPRNNAFYADIDLDCAGPMYALLAYDRPFFRLQNGQPAWHWDVGYQVNDSLLIHALGQMAATIGVETQQDTLTNVTQNDNGITGLVLGSGKTETADLYIDCSGAASLLLGKTFNEPFVSFSSTLPCDRMILGEWGRSDEAIHPHSFVETMQSGWAWQYELPHRIDCGYVYHSGFISDELATQEFHLKYPKAPGPRVVRFSNGRYERSWVKNVVAIGASAGYVEPLASTALGVAAADAQLLVETLSESGLEISAAPVKLHNRHHARVWDGIRRYLAIQYKFNTRLETPFWLACRKDTDLAGAETIIEYYRQCGPSSLWGPMLVDPVDLFGPPSYLGLLIGLKVPTGFNQPITGREREVWQTEVERFRLAATNGITVAEALSMLPDPTSVAGRTPLSG
jgi:tryptophan halogenase